MFSRFRHSVYALSLLELFFPPPPPLSLLFVLWVFLFELVWIWLMDLLLASLRCFAFMRVCSPFFCSSVDLVLISLHGSLGVMTKPTANCSIERVDLPMVCKTSDMYLNSRACPSASCQERLSHQISLHADTRLFQFATSSSSFKTNNSFRFSALDLWTYQRVPKHEGQARRSAGGLLTFHCSRSGSSAAASMNILLRLPASYLWKTIALNPNNICM